jgi:hypothetical protein
VRWRDMSPISEAEATSNRDGTLWLYGADLDVRANRDSWYTDQVRPLSASYSVRRSRTRHRWREDVPARSLYR